MCFAFSFALFFFVRGGIIDLIWLIFCLTMGFFNCLFHTKCSWYIWIHYVYCSVHFESFYYTTQHKVHHTHMNEIWMWIGRISWDFIRHFISFFPFRAISPGSNHSAKVELSSRWELDKLKWNNCMLNEKTRWGFLSSLTLAMNAYHAYRCARNFLHMYIQFEDINLMKT